MVLYPFGLKAPLTPNPQLSIPTALPVHLTPDLQLPARGVWGGWCGEEGMCIPRFVCSQQAWGCSLAGLAQAGAAPVAGLWHGRQRGNKTFCWAPCTSHAARSRRSNRQERGLLIFPPPASSCSCAAPQLCPAAVA